MGAAHYIIFHPERKRVMVEVKALVLAQKSEGRGWRGNVWVDRPNGNEDPFVFVEPWVYTYCHATQLRRADHRKSPFVQRDSYLFFCSGAAANKGMLQIDTVFLVDKVAEWSRGKRVNLPDIFKHHANNSKSRLWQSHLQYGMGKQHKGRFTYLSAMWHRGSRQFSYLPLNSNGERASFPMDLLSSKTKKAILHGVSGKVPVLLDEIQINDLLAVIDSHTSTKVVKNIHRTETTNPSANRRDAFH